MHYHFPTCDKVSHWHFLNCIKEAVSGEVICFDSWRVDSWYFKLLGRPWGSVCSPRTSTLSGCIGKTAKLLRMLGFKLSSETHHHPGLHSSLAFQVTCAMPYLLLVPGESHSALVAKHHGDHGVALFYLCFQKLQLCPGFYTHWQVKVGRTPPCLLPWLVFSILWPVWNLALRRLYAIN